MNSLAEKIENERLSHALDAVESHKKQYGQYFTPFKIADFMASLFPVTDGNISLLDPGAGIGTLSCAFLNRMLRENWKTKAISVSAFDLDEDVMPALNQNLNEEKKNFHNLECLIYNENFLEKTSFDYSFGKGEKFSHVIMNPPYKKILTKSAEREYSRLFGLETVNLYSAFVGASIALLEDNGYLVAILPRSFCNGLYYKPFREYILKNCSIKRIHLFESRKEAFKDEAVLQENIIIMLQKSRKQGDVEISYSKDSGFENVKIRKYSFNEIVNPFDKEKYFCIPTPDDEVICQRFPDDFVSLKETGISVSTGAVVDFRVKQFLRDNPEKNAVPLLYPIHFRKNILEWPKESKKPNAISMAEEIKPMVFLVGNYVVVKRFSTKEENRRIVASLITEDAIKAEGYAFENHLNVFHIDKKGLPKDIAYGLVVWLNTSFLDNQFRLFSGHTQVNATDLRNLPMPKYRQIEEMGKQLQKCTEWSQNLFDGISEEVLGEKTAAANF